MRHPGEIQANYFTNTTIIIFLILTLMTGIGSAATVTYRFLPSTGTSIATGLSTNYGACGANPTTATITLLTTASTSGCAASSATSGSSGVSFIDLYSNTAYSTNTFVTGQWFFGRINNTGGSATVHTYNLIYAYPNGTVVTLPGSGTVSAAVSNTNYNVSMTSISGMVPAGAKLGLRISKASTNTNRVSWFGDTGGVGSVASGYFSVDEVPWIYSITGLVTDISGTPIASATVTTNSTLSTTTNATGWYFLTGVPNATHLITASNTGYSSNTTTVTVNGANVTADTIQLEVNTEATIDATTSTTNLDHRGQPALVFINDTIGYMFYKDSGTATIGYSKTTDGGDTWGARVATTAQTDIAGFNIWYDRWTPGDTTGTIIHIAMTDTGGDDIWYDTVNTNGDAQGTEVALDATAVTLTTTDKLTITKNTTGTIFVGYADASTAGISKVRKCSVTCSTGTNWANAGTSPLTQTTDYIKLVPLASGNVMLIQDLLASNTVRSNIYRTNNTWSGWTTIDASVVENTNYPDTISATVDRSTNYIYLAYGADIAGTNTADIRTAIYNGATWTRKTDVITNANTVTNFDIFRDENTGDIYCAYLRGTAGSSMNAYYKKSTDGMVTWSTENQFNTVTGDLRWMYMNMMSTSRAYAVFLQNTGTDGLFGNTIAVFPFNILSYSNNVTNNNSLSITVNQEAVINFNVTTDRNIDINTVSLPPNVTALSSSSTGGTTFNANFSFPDYGTQYVQFTVRNLTRAGYTTINWTVTVNDVTPPDQVTNVTNTTTPTQHEINLGWDVGRDNTGGSGIKDYFIFIRNNSINWLTKPRPIIDASTSHGNYSDAYRYNARLAVPVSCTNTNCHGGLTTPTHYPFYLKYDATYLYLEAMVADNDSGLGDDYLEILFDPSKNGGTAPQSDDRYYEFWEDGTTKNIFQGNGTDWENYTSSAVWSVKRFTTPDNSNISGNMYEIRIPLSEIGSPVNDSTVRFAIEHECNEGTSDSATWFSRASYLPDTANDTIPDTWNLLFTYRNNTVWNNIGSSTTNSYEATGLLPSFRYYFSVLARDNALNNGTQSASKTLTTSDKAGYDIRGYVTSAGIPINNAHIMTGEYIVHSDANGYYILHDLINGTYNLVVTASGFVSNSSTSITLDGADISNVNITLQDNTPPFVISNTNNAIFLINNAVTLNATITDAGTGVKNVTVDVSSISSTISQAVLTLQGGFWINSSIIADRGASNGVLELTITAYDYYGNVNNTVSMTGEVRIPPTITSWSNNATGDDSLELTVIHDDGVFFNIIADQEVTYTWTYDGIDVNYSDNLTWSFSDLDTHYISAIAGNINGTAYKNWTITVQPETIDVTLTGVPIDFGNVSSGGFTYPSLSPLNVTIHDTTNVNVNLRLSGSDFIYEEYSFVVGNLNYSNSSGGSRTNMDLNFSLSPYGNWINITKRVNNERPIYFWLNIPANQEPGIYGSNITVMVEKYS